MSKRFLKVSLLSLLLVMCMSVAMAADVSEDTTSEVATPQSTDTNNVDTTDYVSTEDNDNEINKQVNPTRSYNPITVNTCINDSTWDNQSYDVYSNVKITTNITQSNNIAFNLNGNNITIDGLNIVNNGTQPIAINVIAGSSDIKILNTNITISNDNWGETKAIVINSADNVLVNNSKVEVSAFAQDMGWKNVSNVWVSELQTSGILVDNSANVILSNNVIRMTNSTEPSIYCNFSTTDAITVREGSTNVTINDNIIDMDGAYYLYGIDLTKYVTNALVENNTLRMTGTNHFCGIQLSSTSDSKVRCNTITGTCSATSGTTASYEGFAYGIALASSYRPTASESTNNLIEHNYINITSNVTYAIELSIADNTKVYNNTAYVYGEVVMALGLYNSSDCEIKDNNFTVTGNTRDLHQLAYDAIPPETTGIKLVDDGYNNTKNNIIQGNRIRVTDGNNNVTAYTVVIDYVVYNTTVTKNYLRGTNTSSNSILDNGDDTNKNPNNVLP